MGLARGWRAARGGVEVIREERLGRDPDLAPGQWGGGSGASGEPGIPSVDDLVAMATGAHYKLERAERYLSAAEAARRRRDEILAAAEAELGEPLPSLPDSVLAAAQGASAPRWLWWGLGALGVVMLLKGLR